MTLSSEISNLAVSSATYSIISRTNALSLARGGAMAAATSTLFNKFDDCSISSLNTRGGSKKGQDKETAQKTMCPKGKSVLYMAIAMSLHYLSYSIARPSTIALFTSAATGFGGNTAAFPLAMAFISPTSLAMLLSYGRILQKTGPKGAVRQTTIMCASALCLSSVLIGFLSRMPSSIVLSLPFLGPGWSIKLVQLVVGALFIFRESYVQLLTSQYWSFMASILTPDQSSKWFSPISGLTSLTSAAAGITVSNLVEKVGLPGALIFAGFILLSSLIFTEKAYSLADAYGFTPAPEQMKKSKRKKIELTTYKEDTSLIKKARALFGRNPVLKALFLEILAGQGLATLLNVCFVTKLSTAKPVDSERAGWMGKFFASINIIAMCLQFGVIPKVMSHLETKFLWRLMPLTMVIAISPLVLNSDPSLKLIGACFMLFKVMEFSIRRMLDEMVYVPLDFESRFLGKEIISVFGYRFGKSGMSLALSGITSLFGNFGIQELSYLTGGSACLWLVAAWNVSNQVLSKADAEKLYQSKNLQVKKNKKWFFFYKK